MMLAYINPDFVKMVENLPRMEKTKKKRFGLKFDDLKANVEQQVIKILNFLALILIKGKH